MRVAIHTGTGAGTISQFAERLRTMLDDAGVEVVGVDDPADLILAAGGDGTMLGAVREAVEWDVPVLGFNLGTLGFLTEADPDAVEDVVRRLIQEDYEIDERMTLRATAMGLSGSGVNDVVVEKVDSTRLVTLSVTIDGEAFATYATDGLIVATPTGSTGYAFSAGGPIVDTSLDAIILTPVATHSLFDRPLVLPSDTEVVIRVTRDRPVRVYVDKTDLGQISEGDIVTVRRGERDARFITFGGTSYSGRVRDKFGLT